MKSSPYHVWKHFVPSALRSTGRSLNVSGFSVHNRFTTSSDSPQSTPNTPTFFQAGPTTGESHRPGTKVVDDIDDLVSSIDPFLPLELRSRTPLENLAQFQGVGSVDDVLILLFEAQQKCQHLRQDLLSYIGLQQNRWDALLWLIKTLLAKRKSGFAMLGDRCLHKAPPGLDWSMNEFAYYPELVAEHLLRSPQRRFPLSLEQATESYKRHWRGELLDTSHDPIGRIWQCVAYLILEAADSGTERSSEIMNYVYQIIACMHDHNVIPSTLYNWKYPEDHTAVQRPPTLHLLSGRIMVTLSNATWKAREKSVLAEAAQVGAKYVYKGFELPGAEYTPRIRPLSLGIWLDLVLWSCLEGGLIMEGAWIVNQILQRDGRPAWSVVSWDTLQAADPSERSTGGGVDWDSPKARFNRVAGTLEGYNEDPPLVDMGTQRISSEVIEALIEGLINNLSGTVEEQAISGVSAILRHVNRCKKLLERGNEVPRSMSWHSIILRLIESGNISPGSAPRILESVIELESLYDGSLTAREEDQSTLGLGKLHLTLSAYISLGLVDAAMRTFRKIQHTINPQRAKSIPSMSNNSLQTRNRKPSAFYIDGSSESESDPSICPPIPEAILASFLDLLTNAGRHDVCRWLIYPEAIYEPVISSTLYASHHLQPALLRYATVTRDEGLLIEVTKSLNPPLSLSIVHALLRCQLTLEKWDAVEDLLDYITLNFSCGVSDSDIMMVAKIIVRLSIQNDQSQSKGDDLMKAQHILQNMLQGSYDGDPDPSSPRDYSRLRLLNQISRVLASTSTYVATIAAPFVGSEGQAHATASISVNAFNILLEGLVETQGAHAGKDFWDLWCRSPVPMDQNLLSDKETNTSVTSSDASGLEDLEIPIITENSSDDLGREKIVTPTRRTVQIILSPVLERIKSEHFTNRLSIRRVNTAIASGIDKRLSSDAQILEWGVARYRELGMTEREIDQEVRGHLKDG